MMMIPDEHSRIEVRPTRRDMRIAEIQHTASNRAVNPRQIDPRILKR